MVCFLPSLALCGILKNPFLGEAEEGEMDDTLAKCFESRSQVGPEVAERPKQLGSLKLN